MFVYAKTPTVAVIDDVLTPEECNEIVSSSKDFLVRSMTETQGVDKDRTSEGVFLPQSDFPEVCSRLSDIANIPLANAEAMNILRYKEGQEYKPHYDALAETDNQRILTCIVYLNNAAGGGTAFPHLNILVGSVQGRLLMFGNIDDQGSPHELSLHQGLPPLEGEKWVFTLWFRKKELS